MTAPLVCGPCACAQVTLHFSRKTELGDYESAAVKTVAKIHRKLPPGGILVFLTGEREVEAACARIRDMFSNKPKPKPKQRQETCGADNAAAAPMEGAEAQTDPRVELQTPRAVGADAEEEEAAVRLGNVHRRKQPSRSASKVPRSRRHRRSSVVLKEEDIPLSRSTLERPAEGGQAPHTKGPAAQQPSDETETVTTATASDAPEDSSLFDLDSSESENEDEADADADADADGKLDDRRQAKAEGVEHELPPPAPVHVLPLYSMLSPESQQRVFQPPPVCVPHMSCLSH